MTELAEKVNLDFYTYPPIGGDDWRYTYQTARVRALEIQMLGKAILLDMANVQDFQQAAELLNGTEYALAGGGRDFSEIENILLQQRTAVRNLFADLMVDESIVELFRARDDFANLRLAIRRSLSERPLGADYSADGNVPPEQMEDIFGEKDDFNKSALPDYFARAIEQAVLAYYQDKDIRRIDYAIDQEQAEYNLKKALYLKSPFLLGLFRIYIDLNNIRTMLRLIFTESEQRNVFLQGGYVEIERFKQALELGYEALGALFFATPYQRIVETGANYLALNKSFLKVEQQCEEYLNGFLQSTVQITAGPQPIIAYLLMKENEIRTVRLILTARKNFLVTRLILDRIS